MQGVRPDPRILDMSDFQVMTAKFLEEKPVVVIAFKAQQVHCFKESSTGKIIEGREDDLRANTYMMALRQEIEPDQVEWVGVPEWKIVEFFMQSSPTMLV